MNYLKGEVILRVRSVFSIGSTKFVLLAAVILVFLSTCLTAYAASKIEGTVTDIETGAPVSGALVELNNGQSTTCLADGSYSISGLAAGTYIMTVGDGVHYTATKSVTVGEDTTVVVNVQLVAFPEPTIVVSDTFTRDPSDDLGTTEDENHYLWEKGPAEVGASIADGKLVQAEDPTGNFIGGVSVGGGFAPSDFELTETLTIQGGTWAGVSYRQSQPGTFDIFWGQPEAAAGYLVYCMANGTSITLHRNGPIASAQLSPAVDWSTPHTLKVRAVGARHQVWLDGKLVINAVNGGKLAGGYVGCLRHASGVTVDDFTVGTFVAPTGTISGKVYDADNVSLGIANALVRTANGQEATTDSNGNYSLVVSAIEPTQLTVIHDDYFSQTVNNVEPVPFNTVTVDVALLHLPTPGPADIVTDTFTRDDNTSLGTTEDANQYPWTLGSGETMASVSFNQLRLGYGSNLSGVSVGDFFPANLDMTVDLTIEMAASQESWIGVGYRQSLPGTLENFWGQTGEGAGYVIFSPSDGTSVTLRRMGRDIAVADMSWSPIPWWFQYHTLRIKAIGPHHEIWLDNVKIIDAFDYEKLSGGYVSFLRYDSEALFDNLSITRYGVEPGQITGIVHKLGDPNSRISGAKVTLHTGRYAITDANGEYSFTGLSLGGYSTTVSADGYYARTSTGITLTESNPTAVHNVGLYELPAVSATVTDTFTRPDNTDLGTTEDALQLPWLKTDGDDTPRIAGGCLQFDPFFAHGVSLGGDFLPADVDMSVELTGIVGAWGGVAYRQNNAGSFDNHHGADLSRAGYLVWCPADGTAVHLFRAGAFLKSAQFSYPIDWMGTHTLRVRAIGIHHEVWLDGEKIIDAFDSGKLGGGYAGIYRDSAYMNADNFALTAMQPISEATIMGSVYDADNPTLKVAGATVTAVGQASVTDADGNYTLTLPGSSVVSGPVTITISAKGYLTTSVVSSNGIPGQTVTRDIAIRKLPAANLVYDTFSRPDSINLGTTEDDLHRSWVLNPTETAASISSNQLLLGYGPYACGASVSGFLPRDIDMKVDMKIGPDGWGGIIYRQTVPGTFDSFGGQNLHDGGYLVYSPSDGSAINLLRLGRAVASAPMSPAIDWSVPHTIRVTAIADHHQIYLDGNKIIDVFNNEKMTGGYLGCIRWTAETRYDNFIVATGGILPDSIETPEIVSSVVDAKSFEDGTLVELSGPVVTGAYDGFFYVEDIDRTSGIKVVGSQSVTLGQAVKVTGKLDTVNGERCINATDVQIISADNEIKSLMLNGRSFAGQLGLSNIGLLTTIYGRVTEVTADEAYCYIDDGSGVSFEPGTVGIKVMLTATKKPAYGQYISCTGVAGMLPGSIPVLLLRNDDDLDILQ